MENDKAIKENKSTPARLAKSYIRQTNDLLRHKTDGAIGPKYIFLSPRVPQIKLFI